MKTSKEKPRQSGFTLVEMLAVLVIIALISAVVVAAAPSRSDDIETQGKAMHRAFAEASERSIISGVPQAFGFSQDGYLFYEYVDGDWVILTEKEWPEDSSVQFFKEDIEIEAPKDPVPMIVFEPVGFNSQFDLYVEGDVETLLFSSEGNGRIEMETIQ